MEELSKSRIARNTVFLYFRMLFVMGVTLYTSRAILEILGIEDFGIYQSVGGIVGMMSFVNSAISAGTSRFITYELGRNDRRRLEETFCTTVNIQIFLILLIILVAETLGSWFVIHKLQIPDESRQPALWAYHLSIFTTAVSLFTIPYQASVIAHERMKVFAYIGIIEVCSKLGIVYLLILSSISRLVTYAFLLLIVQIAITSFYVIYCTRTFDECRYRFVINRDIMKQIAGFSGWNLFASTSMALNNQGVLVLLNVFFSPAVVTARAISLQVNTAANQFVNNFRLAVNPQIVKQYAAGNLLQSKNLLLSSTKFSYYLMFIISLPIFMGAKPLLSVWLKIVPDYTTIFLQLVIIQSLFQVFDTSFYTALYAKGDLKLNALISPTVGFLMFPIVYILFRNGASPIALSWASLVMYALLGLIVKPILIIKIADYKWKEILGVYQPCLIVSLIAGFISYMICREINIDKNFLQLCATTGVCLVISFSTIYVFGLDKNMRSKIISLIKKKL